MPFLIIAGALIILASVLYNILVAKKNQVNNALATIKVWLKNRYDLIPNLVATVQEYMQYERETLSQITELRAKASCEQLSDNQRIELENKVSRLLGGIMVAVENYPELKANQNFLQLQAVLNEIEEQISTARRDYNAAVTDLNNAIEMFPTNILASLINLEKRELLEIPEQQQQGLKVKDLFAQK
ncbi:MAG: LemA family protein [Candidatus Omnitrophica bacterium]|nr:LemA family protein [Candidatus Omnitrophota bacterium]